MLTKMGYIDGIHGSPYIAAKRILYDPMGLGVHIFPLLYRYRYEVLTGNRLTGGTSEKRRLQQSRSTVGNKHYLEFGQFVRKPRVFRFFCGKPKVSSTSKPRVVVPNQFVGLEAKGMRWYAYGSKTAHSVVRHMERDMHKK